MYHESDLREMTRVIRDIKKTKGWDHLIKRARDGVVSTRHASAAALLGGPVGARIVRVFAWKEVDEGEVCSPKRSKSTRSGATGSGGAAWEEIESLVRKLHGDISHKQTDKFYQQTNSIVLGGTRVGLALSQFIHILATGCATTALIG